MKTSTETIDSYKLKIGGIIVDVNIYSEEGETVPIYNLSILNISQTTRIILAKLREEFVSRVNVGAIEISEEEGVEQIKDKFQKEIMVLIHKYFPEIDSRTSQLLVTHVIQQNVGLGNIEFLLRDKNLEEITINNATEPVWVYHRAYGWLKTNIKIPNEETIRHYATLIGRDVGKEITLLKPLMDAHLKTGSRVNSTLSPISTKGNTITIRKFAEKPWSIVDLINNKTISLEAAAWIWMAMQNELSLIISGGTGSGKTSTLNAIANFFPPNQRIISIEDTRELTLPKNLHWVPMETRLPNPEGKGEITMLDLLVNALRMRPDRILLGEIRRKKEAEVLFEAMHTGHSVYATLHANNAEETIMRLTNPPIDMPRGVLGALSLILVQNRNRRTGLRRTLQLAEVLEGGDTRILMQLNVANDTLEPLETPTRVLKTLGLYTGMTPPEISKDLTEKVQILKWLVGGNIADVHEIGLIIAKYYLGKLNI